MDRCIHVVIPLHVELLNKHKSNIEKFSELKEWRQVHREQINATRTVEQLKSDMWSLDLLRHQVLDEDLVEFDKRTKKTQDTVMEAVRSFTEESGKISEIHFGHSNVLDGTSLETQLPGRRQSQLDHGLTDEVLRLESEQILKEELEKSRQVEGSWKHLNDALQDFKYMMDTLSTCVHQQQEPINSIQQNLESAQENVSEGQKFLEKAAKYKAAVYPVTGAVIGGCLGGPIGLFVGMKAGAAALAIGGLLGFQGGRFLKTKLKQSTDVEEMQTFVDTERHSKLTRKTSSMPDVSGSEFKESPS